MLETSRFHVEVSKTRVLFTPVKLYRSARLLLGIPFGNKKSPQFITGALQFSELRCQSPGRIVFPESSAASRHLPGAAERMD